MLCLLICLTQTSQSQLTEITHILSDQTLRQSVGDIIFDADDNTRLQITISVGVALNEGDNDTPETILKRAGVALYLAKTQGRNRVVFDAA